MLSLPKFATQVPKQSQKLTDQSKEYLQKLTSKQFYIDAQRMTSRQYRNQRSAIVRGEKALIQVDDPNDVAKTIKSI